MTTLIMKFHVFLHFDSSRLLICCEGHDSAFKTAKILSVAISDRLTPFIR